MPELPEVETLCRQLNSVIYNKQILGFEILDFRLGIVGGLVGKKIASVIRRGKYIEMKLNDDTLLLLHLRMTGRLQWQSGRRTLPPHTRFIIAFPGGRLLCIDPRRFATLTLRNDVCSEAFINDPLQEFPACKLRDMGRAKKLPVKSFLMDQRIIAGIGNIYACEILHETSINPWRPAGDLSQREWEKIAAAASGILHKAVDCRGTTVSDWRDLFGKKGSYQHELKVYDREGLPCLSCHGVIERSRLSGRGTYFCSSCQR